MMNSAYNFQVQYSVFTPLICCLLKMYVEWKRLLKKIAFTKKMHTQTKNHERKTVKATFYEKSLFHCTSMRELANHIFSVFTKNEKVGENT